MFQKIIIIGAGMMGASLLFAIKDKKLAKEQIALIRQEEQIKILAAKGLKATTNYEIIKDADLIIISSNLASYADIITKLNPLITQKTLVSEIGSVKQYPEKLFKEKFKYPQNYIATHPIAGSDKSGLGEIIPNLYQDKLLLITSKASPKTAIIAKFWQEIGMQIEYLPAQKHDDIYAHISHFTQFLAYKLAQELGEEKLKKLQKSADEPLAKTLRLCNSNPKIWQEIFTYNQAALKQIMQLFKQNQAAPIHPDEFSKLQNRFLHLKQDLAPITTTIETEIIKLIFYYLKSLEESNALNYAGSGFKDFIQYFLFAPANSLTE